MNTEVFVHGAEMSGESSFQKKMVFNYVSVVAPSTSSRMRICMHPVCHSAFILQIRKDASAVGHTHVEYACDDTVRW